MSKPYYPDTQHFKELEDGSNRLRTVIQMADAYLRDPQLEKVDPAVFEEALKMLREGLVAVEVATDWCCSDYVQVCRELHNMRKQQARQELLPANPECGVINKVLQAA